MKTEHEKLKYICDKIWYNEDFYKSREIIFTPKFMEKFVDYKPSINMCNLFNHLDNPVEYLYNLLTK